MSRARRWHCGVLGRTSKLSPALRVKLIAADTRTGPAASLAPAARATLLPRGAGLLTVSAVVAL